MEGRDRRSLKGLSLEELKRSTTISSPPAQFVRESASIQRLKRHESSGPVSGNTPSPLPFRYCEPSRNPSAEEFTYACHLPAATLDTIPTTRRLSVFSYDMNSSDVPYPSIEQDQESTRAPLMPFVTNNKSTPKAMDSRDTRVPLSPKSVEYDYNLQNVPSPQPLFGRPTQLGASTQAFTKSIPFAAPSSTSLNTGSQTKPSAGGRTSDGNNHLFISNKSGNKRPDQRGSQGNGNPLLSQHKPPTNKNPLSQMSTSLQQPKLSQNSTTTSRPRQNRIIIDSDDDDDGTDDVFEVPRPANLPTWQPKPFKPPTFSSAQNNNPYFQPKPATTTYMDKSTLVANTVADGGIWEDRYNMADPSIYLDSGKAQEELKALFEGSVEDEDDKPRTRRKRKDDKVNPDVGDVTEKMKAMNVTKPGQKAQIDADEEHKGSDDDEEEDEVDDGTVEGLKVKLLPHQIEGVEWMQFKERGRGKSKKGMTKGGILADDMGLGKTIQSISLILINKPPEDSEVKKGSEIGYDKSTLIVAPLALIKQWEGEIYNRVEASHRFKVCVHHGPQRAKSYKELRKFDIVITTYHTLLSEHSASNDKIRAGCFGTNWYRVILDEAHSIKNRSAQVTKAACALEAQYRWCLTGTPMQNNLDELQSLIAFLKIGPLDKYDYWKSRIIQPMNNGRGGLAIKRLQAALKTMMKRRTKDVLKQNAESQSKNANNGKNGNAGQGPALKVVKRTIEKVEAEFTHEERTFYSSLESRIDAKLERMAANGAKVNYANALVLLLRLRQACNHAKLLGFDLSHEKDALGENGSQTPRRKAGGSRGDDVDDLTMMLGGLNVEMRECDVCQAELSQQEVRNGSVRCAACERDLVVHIDSSKSSSAQKMKNTKSIIKNDRKIKRRVIIDSDDEDDDEDDDKYNDEETKTKTKTVHLSNSDDDDDDEDDEETSTSEDDDDDDDDDDSFTSTQDPDATSIVASTKIRHLLSILRNDSHTNKYIVFSFFTSMLDLIEPFLRQHHIRHVRYDGSMPNHARESSLASLRDDPTTRVLLCSLRAGSLGLNLTAASRVVILEPFWNPFVEEQAIDRVHRLNQEQDVVVYKLTIKDTVEARILELQERKRELARVTVEGGSSAAGAGGKTGVAKLTLTEMMKLFEHSSERDAAVDMFGMKGRDGGLLDGAGGGGRRGQMGESTYQLGDERVENGRGWDSRRAVGIGAAAGGGGGGTGGVKKEWRREHEVYGRRW